MKNKTLIVGASGAFGSELIKYYERKNTICTFNKNSLKRGIKFNAISNKIEKKIKNLENISDGILLFAEKNPNNCFRKKKYSNKLNVESVKNILKTFKRFNIRPIFLSTDLVFSGTKGNYIETSKPKPKTLYGKQKYLVEKFIIKNFKKYLIFRLSKTFCFKDKKNAFLNWINFFDKNDKIYCATDQIYNPIFIKDAAKIVYKISKKKNNGIFNISGYKSYSRYRIFLKLYQEYLKFKKKDVKIIRCKFNDLNRNYEDWPLNTSMNMNKVKKAININLMSVEKALKNSVKLYFKN